ncbi:MAG TPA: TrbI/VirB10 family protein [Rhodanobacteraceae bacterium]
MPAPTTKTPVRSKTNRKLLARVGIAVVAVMIGWLMIRNGFDLGQKKLVAQRAAQAQKARAKTYADKVANPKHASQQAMLNAEATVKDQKLAEQRKQAEAAAEAIEGLPGTAGSTGGSGLSLPPPTEAASRAGQIKTLESVAKAVQAPRGYKHGGASLAQGDADSGTFGYWYTPGGHHGISLVPNPNAAQDASAKQGIAASPELAKEQSSLAQQEAATNAQEKLALEKAEGIKTPTGAGNNAWLFKTGNHSVGTSKPITASIARDLYWLAPGTVIQAVAQQSINTSLPGTLTAVVTRPVYDSRYGTHLVIPQGSKLIGSYNTTVSDGQHRVMLAFTTLVTPAGGLVDLGGLSGADAMGRGGIPGKLHTRFWANLGMTAMLAVGAIESDRLQDSTQVVSPFGGNDSSRSLSDGGQIFENFANKMMQERFGVGPYITAPAGARVSIVLNRGVDIPPIANSR